jgi:hypothetical protein
LVPVGTGLVTDDKGKVKCGTLCLNASASYLSGTTVVLTAKPDALSAFAGWGGQSSGTNPKCTLRMDANKDVTASFSLLGVVASPPATAEHSLDWTIELDVPEGVGQVVLNGQTVRMMHGQS